MDDDEPPVTTTPPGSDLEAAELVRLGADDLDELEFPVGIRLNVRLPDESLPELDDEELELPELPPEELDPDEPLSPDEPDDPDDPEDVEPPRGTACAPATAGAASATARPRTTVKRVDPAMVIAPEIPGGPLQRQTVQLYCH